MANILIIGGGVSGLSAGIYARLNGHRATVCERLPVAGGNLTGWQRKGYRIDNCIHWLTGTNPATPTYRMWVELGALGDVEVYQGETLYTCEYNGQSLSLCRDAEELGRAMLALSPEDEREIRAFLNAVRLVRGFCGIGGETYDRGIRRGELGSALPTLLRDYRMTTGELASRFRHPLLRQFITAFLGEDFAALALITVAAQFCGNNGGIPVGGSMAMRDRMVARLRELGGELLPNREATRIEVRDGRAVAVDFADGSSAEPDYVILTTDPAVTFGTLLPCKMPRGLRRQYRNPAMVRFSSCQCAFSCDREALPFRGELALPVPTGLRGVLKGKTVILREFSHEPDFAPAGKVVLQSLIFCDEAEARRLIDLHRDDEYAAEKRNLAEATAALILERFPELAPGLSCLDVWTPATYRRYVASEIGSYMGFALLPGMLPLRLSNRVRGLKNVVLATQWLRAPGGLPIAAEEGKRAVGTILQLERSFRRRRLHAPDPLPNANNLSH